MKYFEWSQYGGADEPERPVWRLSIKLIDYNEWDLRVGRYIETWDPNTVAYYDEEAEHSDFPFTSDLLPVYSLRLKNLMKNLHVEDIQYLPLRIKHTYSNNEVQAYYIANYLKVIDCLDRQHSAYQLWTKENLLFWEKRPWMIGTFRSVRRPVLQLAKLDEARVFRVWGWDMVVVREDIKEIVARSGMTGCQFTELATG